MPGRKVLPTALGVYGLLLACLGAGTFVAPPVILGDRWMYLSTSFIDSHVAIALILGGATCSLLLIPLWIRVFRFYDAPWLGPNK